MIYNNISDLTKTPTPQEMPVIIPTFNNISYLKLMINQLEKFNINNIIVIDNWSTLPGMSQELDIIGQKYTVVKKFTNNGPREYYQNKELFKWLPEKFILTDPDIKFNENLPNNFLESLAEVSEKYNLYKVGFALDIEMNHLDGDTNIREIMFDQFLTMYQWELQFYSNSLGLINENPIWSAAIDTTFCLVNKNFFKDDENDPMKIKNLCARIGGDFTAQHYGWYNNPPVSKDEYEYYLSVVPRQWSFSSNRIKEIRGL
jgi:hypothetical protein